MALRMDDINQKVNAIKLSLQTVDYRLGKQDEIALQTAETLAHIQQISNIQQIQNQMQIQALSQRAGIGDEAAQINTQFGTYLCEPQSLSGLSPCSIGSTGSNSSGSMLSIDTSMANTVPMSAPVG